MNNLNNNNLQFFTLDSVIEHCKSALRSGESYIPVPLNFIPDISMKFPNLKIQAIIGYPMGTGSPRAKCVEVEEACSLDIYSIDFIINVSAIKSRNQKIISEEIEYAIHAAGTTVFQIILQDEYLDDDDIKFALSILSKTGLPIKRGLNPDKHCDYSYNTSSLSDKIAYIDVSEEAVDIQKIPENYRFIFGRALGVKILSGLNIEHEFPLGYYNRLIFSPGLLCGYKVKGADKMSIVSKSPVNGFMRAPTLSGNIAYKMAMTGLRALVLSGISKNWKNIVITNDGIQLVPADEFVGDKTSDLFKKLKKKYGDNIGIAGIGPAGEKMYLTSTIISSDESGIASFELSKGMGFGAIMGSKKIKAIIFIPKDNGFKIPSLTKEFKSTYEEFEPLILNNTITGRSLPLFGESVFVQLINDAGALPTNNFTSGSFERISHINHEAVNEKALEKNKSQFSLSISRQLSIYDTEKELISGNIGYNSLVGFGSNIGIDSIIEIAKITRWAIDFGVDFNDLSITLGLLLSEKYNGDFGNLSRVNDILKQMEKAKSYEKVINQGPSLLGRLLGSHRIPTLCDESLPLFDFRVMKTMGALISVAPTGTDPFSALTINEELLKNENKADRKIEKSILKDYLMVNSILDYYGLSSFMVFPASESNEFFDKILRLSNSALGITIPENEVLLYSLQALEKHIEFNSKASFYSDIMPDFFHHEKLYPLGKTYNIDYFSEENILK